MSTDFNFKSYPKTISEVLFSDHGRKFRIPRYQRPYSWGEAEVNDYWEDLNTDGNSSFFGSIILNNENFQKEGYVDLIDGQQRFLTITISIAVLRDLIKFLNEDEAKRFQRQDIALEDRHGQQGFRIIPSESIFDYFRNNIQEYKSELLLNKPATPEEKSVYRNYNFFKDKVNAELSNISQAEKKIKFISNLRDKISNLKVISIEITREEDAYEIFETTNARGLDLSVSDLLKNLIFKKLLPEDDEDFAKDVWKEITTNIESTSTELKKYIRYFWISKYSFVTEKKLYREIKNQVTDWRKLLECIWDDSEWYNKLLQGEEKDFQDIKEGDKIFNSVFALRLMSVSQCYVLLLSILRNQKDFGTKTTRIFKLIENFTFIYSIVCKMPPNKVERIYSKTALKIEKAISNQSKDNITKNIQTIFHELERELKSISPSETMFLESFDRISYNNSEKARNLIRYVLGSINDYYSKTSENKIAFKNVNIEHILPQNPDKNWKLKKKEIKHYVNSIGNLTLLWKVLNSKAQNATIEKKLIEFKESELPITKDLVSFIENNNTLWNEDLISERRINLAKLAFNKIWKI